MRAFTIVSALVAVAFSGVVATPGEAISTLFARQNSAVPEIPAECKAKCVSIQAITACGADLACMCSQEMGQGLSTVAIAESTTTRATPTSTCTRINSKLPLMLLRTAALRRAIRLVPLLSLAALMEEEW
ncbi:hypothetical protein B0J17DRAFT_721101 [Rhizoctonia solani]|nr:hypothetical protein B0J17DRAFT_721101 [Rhizoctonia solani]